MKKKTNKNNLLRRAFSMSQIQELRHALAQVILPTNNPLKVES